MFNNRKALDRIKAATVAIAYPQEGNKEDPFAIVGSGFCIDPDGFIVTSRHVVDAFASTPHLEHVEKTPAVGKLPDGRELLPGIQMQPFFAAFYFAMPDNNIGVALQQAFPVMVKMDHDLALIRVSAQNEHFPNGHPTVNIAQPEEIHEGDEVGVCGFPFGHLLRAKLGTVTSSFTKGILSAVIPGSNAPRKSTRAYQLDVRAAPGNSGGPVFLWDTGKVFGVLESGMEHLTKAAALHQLLDSENLEEIKCTKVGEVPPRH